MVGSPFTSRNAPARLAFLLMLLRVVACVLPAHILHRVTHVGAAASMLIVPSHAAAALSAHAAALATRCACACFAWAQVEVRVGGDFVLQPDSLTTQASLFIAGGIGITALASMIGHIAEAAHVAGAESGRTAGTAGTSHQQQQRQQDGVGASGQQQPATAGGWHGGAGCALLLYSASSPEEFALLPQLLRWQQAARRRLRLQLHTTQGHGRAVALQQLREQASPGVRLLQHRLGISDLRAAIDQLRPLHAASTSAAAVSNAGSTAVVGEGGGTAREQAWLNAYVCGPQAMIDDMEAQLQQLGVTRVFSEKWW